MNEYQGMRRQVTIQQFTARRPILGVSPALAAPPEATLADAAAIGIAAAPSVRSSRPQALALRRRSPVARSEAVWITSVFGISIALASLAFMARPTATAPTVGAAGGRSSRVANVLAVAKSEPPAAARALGHASASAAPIRALDAVDPVITAGSAPTTIAHVTSLTPSTSAALPRGTWREVQDQAQAAIALRFTACNGHLGHHAYIRVLYEGATGRPSAVEFTGHTLDGNPLTACLETAVRAVSVAPFREAQREARYSIMIR